MPLGPVRMSSPLLVSCVRESLCPRSKRLPNSICNVMISVSRCRYPPNDPYFKRRDNQITTWVPLDTSRGNFFLVVPTLQGTTSISGQIFGNIGSIMRSNIFPTFHSLYQVCPFSNSHPLTIVCVHSTRLMHSWPRVVG